MDASGSGNVGPGFFSMKDIYKFAVSPIDKQIPSFAFKRFEHQLQCIVDDLVLDGDLPGPCSEGSSPEFNGTALFDNTFVPTAIDDKKMVLHTKAPMTDPSNVPFN